MFYCVKVKQVYKYFYEIKIPSKDLKYLFVIIFSTISNCKLTYNKIASYSGILSKITLFLVRKIQLFLKISSFDLCSIPLMSNLLLMNPSMGSFFYVEINKNRTETS